MKKGVVLFLLAVLATGCKDKAKGPEYDSSQIAAVSDFVYEYENGKKVAETETMQSFIRNHVMGTYVFRHFYKYNEKGLLVKETRSFNDEPESDYHSYSYNSLDSLISEIRISDGDTTDVIEYGYFPDGRKDVFRKLLKLITLKDIDPTSDIDLEIGARLLARREYNTFYYRSEYNYDNRLCQAMNIYNQYDELQTTVEYEYANNDLIKETHYAYPNSVKTVEKTVFYDYSKSKDTPDMFSLGTVENDTINQTIHSFEKGILVSTYNSYNRKYDIDQTYYTKGRIDKMVNTSQYIKQKSTTIFTYYDNGDVKKTVEYREDL